MTTTTAATATIRIPRAAVLTTSILFRWIIALQCFFHLTSCTVTALMPFHSSSSASHVSAFNRQRREHQRRQKQQPSRRIQHQQESHPRQTDPFLRSSSSSNLPRLIVFDLDNTIWTPELYQLRKLQRQNTNPIAGRDVELFPDIPRILNERIPSLRQRLAREANDDDHARKYLQLGVASRTQSGDWAQNLLDQFDLRRLMGSYDTNGNSNDKNGNRNSAYIQIFPGNKIKHFSNIQRETGVPFHEMMFFDDARDGKYGNCLPVASQLGVLCVHCPNGLSMELFDRAIDVYQNEWDKSPSTIVEWDGRVTTINLLQEQQQSSETQTFSYSSSSLSSETFEGTVKLIRQEKRFGFIRYRQGNSKDIFFHFNNLADSQTASTIEEGDRVTFQRVQDPNIISSQNSDKSKKDFAVNVAVTKSSSVDDSKLIEMRCFSMNQPFAALLANGIKTLETRNGTMFSQYTEGTQMLLHVGQRTYPDGNKHIDIFQRAGMTDDEIEQSKRLPDGFGRGNIVAILELGKTYETTLAERSDNEFERKVGAYGSDSGRIVTEIKRVSYLKKPIRRKGEAGVFKVRIDPDLLPNDFDVPITIGEKDSQGDVAIATISG